MSVTRLKRKNRKDKAKSARRRQGLKLQNFQPVMKTVDVEKIKEEFKAKKRLRFPEMILESPASVGLSVFLTFLSIPN